MSLCQRLCVFSLQLSAEQRHEMCDHRRRAVQREVDRQSQQRNKLFSQVQDILDQVQASSTVWSWSEGCDNVLTFSITREKETCHLYI